MFVIIKNLSKNKCAWNCLWNSRENGYIISKQYPELLYVKCSHRPKPSLVEQDTKLCVVKSHHDYTLWNQKTFQITLTHELFGNEFYYRKTHVLAKLFSIKPSLFQIGIRLWVEKNNYFRTNALPVLNYIWSLPVQGPTK